MTGVHMSDFRWRIWMKKKRREALEHRIVDAVRAGRDVMITIDLTVLVYLALCVLAA